MGELGVFMRLSKVVFMGGSLVPKGGHNPLEPLRLGCLVLTGPNIDNFSSIYKELGEKSAAIITKGTDDLTLNLEKIFANYDEHVISFADNAAKILATYADITKKTVKAIEPFLVEVNAQL
jgi:3-deoxy-D-manno-octulosonic-acid transferase